MLQQPQVRRGEVNTAAQLKSSFGDADLFGAATAAAPVEQREAGGE